MNHMRHRRGTRLSKETLCGVSPTANDLLHGYWPPDGENCVECVATFERGDTASHRKARGAKSKRGDNWSRSVQAIKEKL